MPEEGHGSTTRRKAQAQWSRERRAIQRERRYQEAALRGCHIGQAPPKMVQPGRRYTTVYRRRAQLGLPT